MFLVGIISWWYGDGIKRQFNLLISRAESSLDLFSIKSLVLTWWSPYKQIAANLNQSDNFPDRVRAGLDKLISRIIGGFIRTFMIIIGLLLISLQFIFGLILIIFWLFLPILPIVCLVLFFTGVNLPWTI